MKVTYNPPSPKRITLSGSLGEEWCRVNINHLSLSLAEADDLARALKAAIKEALADD